MKRVLLLCALALLSNCARAETARVHIVGPDEKPIPDAEIIYKSPHPEDDYQTIKADAEGRASIEVKSRGNGKLLSRGRIFSIAAGFAPTVTFLGADLPAETPVRLQVGREVSGIVQDLQNMPVANARVSLETLGSGISLFDHPWDKRFQTTTDAEGRWTISNVRNGRIARVRLDDPRFVAHTVISMQDDGNPLTLVARSGATLEGRVLQDGAPVAGVRAIAQRLKDETNLPEQTRTDAEGRYRFTGLSNGTYAIRFLLPESRARVAMAIENVAAVEGATTPLPDTALVAGALVEGTVRDAVTQQPLANVRVNVYGPHHPSSFLWPSVTSSDAQGRYRTRVAAGANELFTNISAYKSSEKQSVNAVEAQTSTVDFALSPAPFLEGTARDEAGKVVAGAEIHLVTTEDSQTGSRDTTDAAGRFRLDNLPEGKITLRVGGKWQIVTPTTVTIPANNTVLTLRARPTATLGGRVVDDKGAPMAGVKIVLLAFSEFYVQEEELVTGPDGRYEWRDIVATSTISIDVSKAGWFLKTPSKVTLNKEIVGIDGVTRTNPTPTFTVSDAVLEWQGRTLSGTVSDVTGAPFANAVVAAGGAQTRTDAEGGFSLTKLTAGELEIFAATASEFGSAKASAKSTVLNVQLALQKYQRQNSERARSILRDIATNTTEQNFNGYNTLAATLVYFDPRGALQFHNEFKTKNAAWPLLVALSQVAADATRPEKMREEARAAIQELLAEMPTTGDAGIFLAMFAADAAPEWSKTAWNSTRGALKPLTEKPDWPQLASRSAFAQLGMRLKIDGAEKMLDEVLAISQKIEAAEGREVDEAMGFFRAFAEGAAQFSHSAEGMTALQKVLAATPEKSRVEVLGTAIPILARRNLPVARELLEQLAALAPKPGETPVVRNGPRSSLSDFDYSFGKSAQAVVRELSQGKTPDGAAALAIARRIKSASYLPIALAFAARALPQQQAEPVWREAFKAAPTQEYPGGEVGFILGMVLRSNRALGEKLAAEAETRLPVQVKHSGWARERAALAFALAPFQPGRARMLLEETWARRFSGGHFLESHDEAALALAMSAFDVERALEWAGQIGAPNSAGDENPFASPEMPRRTQQKIAAFLLADETERARHPVTQWARAIEEWNTEL
ncbi:MAG TPA: carboxypeptidase-like regulatory domain-containing protein [Abditibacteriaceae bacterium]|jgi:hypothetical protein